MYTVLRFCGLSDDNIQSLGQQIEALLPGRFDGADIACPNRVSICLADEDEWGLHIESLMEKLALLDEVIATMRNADRAIELDIAVEPEDYDSLLSELVFPIVFLEFLVSRKIRLRASIYGNE